MICHQEFGFSERKKGPPFEVVIWTSGVVLGALPGNGAAAGAQGRLDLSTLTLGTGAGVSWSWLPRIRQLYLVPKPFFGVLLCSSLHEVAEGN